MSSHFRYSFLPSALDPASSTGFQSPTPFIPSTQVPYSTPLSCDTRWPGSQGPSFIQSPPNLTNTMPSIPVLQDAQTQVSSKAADPSLSLPANGPVADYQPHGSLFPYSQHSPFPCTDSETDPTEKRPPRPRASNAFILFRSDFLRRKLISRGQEARQHKLSIIAAKCWHKLTREEKRKWFLEAEREKKAHALKYGDYQSQARTRARTRRESRIMASPGELEHLGRLADMAYQEIINDTPWLARECPASLSTSMTTALASGSPSSTQDCYQAQERPFSFPAEQVGQLALPQSYQVPQKAGLGDFSSTFQDADMFPNVSHFYAASYRAVRYNLWLFRLVLMACILQQLLDLRLPRCARPRVAFLKQQHDNQPLCHRSLFFGVLPRSMTWRCLTTLQCLAVQAHFPTTSSLPVFLA